MGFLSSSVCVYSQPMNVKIHSCSLFFISFSAVTLIFLGYIVIWQGVKNHGFQKISDVEGVVYTQVLGSALVNGTLWDNGDYVVPPKENGAFTIPTSILVTRQKNTGTCSQATSVNEQKCTNDSDCPANEKDYIGNGVMTGKCLPNGMCELYAWCPVQDIEDIQHRIFIKSANFTVYVRNDVNFPEIHKRATNIPFALQDERTFRQCHYDPDHALFKNCPKFTPRQIVQLAGFDYEDSDIERFGAVIKMVIHYNCCFGASCFWYWYTGDECLPTYEFERMDQVYSHTKRHGFDEKYADYKWTEGKLLPAERTLYRLFGVRVVVTVQGEGHEFQYFKFFDTIFSGLSSLGLVTLIISFLLAFCHTPEGKHDPWKNFRPTCCRWWQDKKTSRLSAEDKLVVDQPVVGHIFFCDSYSGCKPSCFTGHAPSQSDETSLYNVTSV